MRRPVTPLALAAFLAAAAIGVGPAAASPAAAAHPRATNPVPGTYLPVVQFRALDTTVRAGGSVTVRIGGRGGVPASAAAVALTVQAGAPTASGALTVFPAGTARPDTTSVGFSRGHGSTQAALTRLGGGALTIANRSSGRTEVTVDVSGYYVGGTVDNSEPGLVHLLRSPVRVFDTRPSNRYLHGGAVRTVAIGHGVPTSGVGAVAVMLSAASPVRAGSLVAYAAGNDQPTSPTVAFAAGRSNTSFAWVPTKSDGTISVANTSARGTQVVVDVVGWTNAGVAHVAGALQPRFPATLVHNKNLGAGQTLTVPVAGRGGVPLQDVRAVIVSLTVGAPATQHLVQVPLTRGAFAVHNPSRAAVAVSADVVGFVPSTTLPVPPASISRYLGDLNGTPSHDDPIMVDHGCSDAQAIVGVQSPLVLLDVGAQSIHQPLTPRNPGVLLTKTLKTVRLDYPGLVSVLNSYIDHFQKCAQGTAATIAIGTNNDGDFSSTDPYTPAMRGADWANLVIDMVDAPTGLTIVGADDIEAGFASTQAQARDWESNYLQNASRSHALIFNGSADGCPDGFGGTGRACAGNGYTQRSIYDLAHTVPADAPSGSQILAMPQIYGPSDAAKWTNIDRTGGGGLVFAGVLTQHTLDPTTYTASSGWTALRYALGTFSPAPFLPAVSDIHDG